MEPVVEQLIVVPKISVESVVPVRSALRASLVVEELVEAPKWSTRGPPLGLRRPDYHHFRF